MATGLVDLADRSDGKQKQQMKMTLQLQHEARLPLKKATVF